MLMRTSSPKLCDYPVRSVEKLRYADTDRNGHISNAVFAVCCQDARMELLCDPNQVPIPADSQFAIAKLVLEFRAEMHWPGAVEVGTSVTRVGRSSVVLAQALYVGDRCVAVAESTVVLMDRTSRRSRPLTLEAAEALQRLVRPDGARMSAQMKSKLRVSALRDFAARAVQAMGRIR